MVGRKTSWSGRDVKVHKPVEEEVDKIGSVMVKDTK